MSLLAWAVVPPSMEEQLHQFYNEIYSAWESLNDVRVLEGVLTYMADNTAYSGHPPIFLLERVLCYPGGRRWHYWTRWFESETADSACGTFRSFLLTTPYDTHDHQERFTKVGVFVTPTGTDTDDPERDGEKWYCWAAAIVRTEGEVARAVMIYDPEAVTPTSATRGREVNESQRLFLDMAARRYEVRGVWVGNAQDQRVDRISGSLGKTGRLHKGRRLAHTAMWLMTLLAHEDTSFDEGDERWHSFEKSSDLSHLYRSA